MPRDLLVVSAPVEVGVKAFHKIHELRSSSISVVILDESFANSFPAEYLEAVVAVDTSSYLNVARAIPRVRGLGKFDGVFVLDTGQQYRRLMLLGLLCKGRRHIMNENMDWFELRDLSASFRHWHWRMQGRPMPLSPANSIIKSLIAGRVLLHACYWQFRSIVIRLGRARSG